MALSKYTPLYLALLVCSLFVLDGCKSCVQPSQQIQVKDLDIQGRFSQIQVFNVDTVILETDSVHRVRVEADDNLLGIIRAEVAGNDLIIEKTDCIQGNPTLKVYVAAPRYTSIESNGESFVQSINPLLVEDSLYVGVTPGGEVTLEIQGEQIDAFVTGDGVISFNGDAANLNTIAYGLGRINAGQLFADSVRARGHGASITTLEIKDYLEAYGYDTAQIRYRGNPQVQAFTENQAQVVGFQ